MDKEPTQEGGDKGRLTLGRRSLWCFGIIFLGMILAAPHPGAILYIPYYPIGLDKVLGTTDPSGSGGVGYLIFLPMIAIALSTTRRVPFSYACVVLAGICVLTTKGCHEILSGLSGIH